MKQFKLPKSFLVESRIISFIFIAVIVWGYDSMLSGPVSIKVMYPVAVLGVVAYLITSFKYLNKIAYEVSENGFKYKDINDIFKKSKFREGSWSWEEIKWIGMTRGSSRQLAIVLKNQETNPIFRFSLYGFGIDIYEEIYNQAKDKTKIELDKKLTKKLVI